MHQFFDKEASPLLGEQIRDACNGLQDYYVTGPGVGGAELIGKRDSQEDRMIFCEFHPTASSQFSSLSDEQKEQLFQRTFADMQQHIVANLDEIEAGCQGATAVVVWLEAATQTCWSASLGDGQIFSVLVASNGILKDAQELNHRHNPEAPRERLRLAQHAMQMGKELDDLAPLCGGAKRRLASVLAVSRAFGDTDYDDYGMIHVPEIQKTQHMVSEGDAVFIVSACDGLTEGNAITASTLSKYISDYHRSQDCGQMAQGLAALAVQQGSRDNISVQIVALTALSTASVHMLAIFDGHGGSVVAEHLKTHFERIFLWRLALAC